MSKTRYLFCTRDKSSLRRVLIPIAEKTVDEGLAAYVIVVHASSHVLQNLVIVLSEIGVYRYKYVYRLCWL